MKLLTDGEDESWTTLRDPRNNVSGKVHDLVLEVGFCFSSSTRLKAGSFSFCLGFRSGCSSLAASFPVFWQRPPLGPERRTQGFPGNRDSGGMSSVSMLWLNSLQQHLKSSAHTGGRKQKRGKKTTLHGGRLLTRNTSLARLPSFSTCTHHMGDFVTLI